MLEIKINQKNEKKAVILELHGKVDTQGTEILREKLNGFLASDDISNIILNFENCDFITSVGLGMLVGAQKNAREQGKSLKFISLHKNIESIFKITNLFAFFQVVESEEKALEE